MVGLIGVSCSVCCCQPPRQSCTPSPSGVDASAPLPHRHSPSVTMDTTMGSKVTDCVNLP